MEKKRKIGGLILSAVLLAVALGPAVMASEAGVEIEITRGRRTKATEFEEFSIDEFWMKSEDGIEQLATVFYPNEAGEYPLILIFHGSVGVAKFYGGFMKELVERGYVVAEIDLPGQGLSYGVMPSTDYVYDVEYLALNQIYFLDYLLAHDKYGPMIDDAEIGLWGWSLGSVVGGKTITLEPRIKSASLMGPPWDLSSFSECLKDTAPQITIPTQVEVTINSLHDFMATPYYVDPVLTYKALKGPKQLLIHDQAPIFGGMMKDERFYHYTDEVGDWFDYWLKGDESKYDELIAPCPYCTIVPKAYYFSEDDYCEITPEAEVYLNSQNKRYGGNLIVRALFPVLGPLLYELAPFLRPILELVTKFLPYGIVWWGLLEHIEVTIPKIGDLVGLILPPIDDMLELLMGTPLWTGLFIAIGALFLILSESHGFWVIITAIFDIIHRTFEIVPPL